jgi:hypothetical protein
MPLSPSSPGSLASAESLRLVPLAVSPIEFLNNLLKKTKIKIEMVEHLVHNKPCEAQEDKAIRR